MVFHKDQLLVLFYLLFIAYICDLFIVNKDVNFLAMQMMSPLFVTGMSFGQIIPELESILSDISL